MSRKLLMLLWLPSVRDHADAVSKGQSTPYTFEVLTPAGQRVQSGQARLSELPRNLPCIALLHPDDITLLSTDLPKLSVKQLQDGLAFLIENQLLTPAEDNWVALQGPLGNAMPDASGKTTSLISVVSKSTLRQAIEPLANSGLWIEKISAEPLELAPKSRAGWIIAHHQYAWVCTSQSAPWVIDTALLSDPAHAASSATRFGWWQQQLPKSVSDWVLITAKNQPADALVSLLPFTPQTGDRSWLVSTENRPGCIPPAAQKKLLGKLGAGQRAGQGLRTAYALVAVLAIGWIVGLNAYAYLQNKRLQGVQNMIEQAYNDALPNTPMLADPILLMERAKNEAQKGNGQTREAGFSFLMHQAGLAMSSLPINIVEVVSWHNKRLLLTLNTDPGADTRAAIEAALKAQQISAQWAQDDKKRATLSLSLGGRP